MYYTPDDIFQIMKDHLENLYGIHDVQRNSNLYTDLHLDSMDRLEIYAWIEEKFAIRVPFIHFTTVEALSNKIYAEIPNQYKSPEFQKYSFMQRVKQKFIQR